MSVTQARELVAKHHKYAWALMLVSLLIVVGALFKQGVINIQAATYYFTQSSWAGGVSATTASHNTDQTTWTKYATSTGVTILSNYPTLNTNSFSFTDDGATSTTPTANTSGGGFANGATSSTKMTGTGTGASIALVLNCNATFTGTVATSTSGNYCVARFTTGNATMTIATTVSADYLVVAGGGGGGNSSATCCGSGGGGGGGVVFGSGYNVAASTPYTVTVGNGGSAATNGQNSIFDTVTSTGGGAGGAGATANGVVAGSGAAGGSGGGSGGGNTAGSSGGVASPAGQGYAGGPRQTNNYGAGGGGGGAIGSLGGGIGISSSITGTATYYAGGGGGGAAGAGGGSGGGGTGGNGSSGGVAGTVNTGGGGGGAGWSAGAAGGAGGKGVVVVRYVNYPATGMFTSAVINLGAKTNFTTFSASTTIPGGTGITFDVRAGDSATAPAWGATDSNWTSTGLTGVSGSSGSISALGAHQYVQYRATLTTSDVTVTPVLDSVTINDVGQYNTTGNLTSSVYDTVDATNILGAVSWTASSTSGTETVALQIRSSADNSTWTSWCGATLCNNTDTFTTSPTTITSSHPIRTDGIADRYIQYKVLLASAGAVTPSVTQVRLTYVVNAPPAFDATYGTNGISVSQSSASSSPDFGKVSISYKVRDTDTTTGTASPGYVTPSFEYNVGGGWQPLTTNLAAGDTSNKAVEEVNYNTYTATWTASSTVTANTASAQVRVTVNDNEAANSTAIATSGNFTFDTTLPVITSAVINSSAGGSTGSGNTTGTITVSVTDTNTKQYRLCNNSAFPSSDSQGNSCGWSALASTISGDVVSNWVFTGANAAETVYMQARDLYGNVSATRTIIAPAMPTSVLAADISNPPANSFGETISWLTVSNASTYNLYYATTSSSSVLPTSYAFLVNQASNVYTHGIATATTSAYWYRVNAVNANGDISNFSVEMTAGDVPDSFGTSLADTTPPVISNIAAPSGSLRSTSAVITFTTDELATARVLYGTTYSAGCGYGLTASTTSYMTAQSVTVSSLSPGTTYYYCVRATDIFGNTSAATTPSPSSFATVGGPTVSNVTLQNIAATSVTVAWNTATSSDSYVYYSTSSSLTNPIIVGNATLVPESGTPGVFSHQVGLTGLSGGTLYYFQVKTTDGDGNTVTDSNNGSYYSFTTLSDTTAPTISNIATPVLSSTAGVIVWQTDEPATSQVAWGTASTSLVNGTFLDPTKSIYHVATLSSLTQNTAGGYNTLTPATQYFYTVTSADAAGNSTTSGVNTLTTADAGNVTIIAVSAIAAGAGTADTTAPNISAIKISDITPFGATVAFTTDEVAASFVDYGKDTTYGTSEGNSAWLTTHEIKLHGLSLGTDYQFQIKAIDKSGNTGTSANQTFKTTFLTERLKDLAKIENIEAFQKEIEDTIESILPSLVPPFVSKPQVSDVTDTGATVTFRTNIKAFPIVAYVEGGAYNAEKEDPYTGEISDTEKKATEHELKLTGLKPNTTYHYQARAFSLPKVIGKSVDLTFITKAGKIAGSIVERKKDSFTVVWTTPEPTTSIVEYKDLKRGVTERKIDDAKKTTHSIKVENLPSGTAYDVNISGVNEQGNTIEAGSPLSVTTSTDTTPPAISGFKVDNALVPGRTDRIQTIVSWVTDEPGNGTVYFEEGAGSAGEDKELANKTEVLDSYVTAHSIIIPSLKPGTIYRLKVVSSDDSGNQGSFGPRTVITPKQTESITDIIFKNFEDSFKFLRKV